MFASVVRTEVSQGDIFPTVKVLDYESSGQSAPAPRQARVMVLSHDCDYDKLELGAKAEHVLVLEVRDPSEAPDGLWGLIQGDRVWNALHLPGLDPPGFLDFRRVFRVRKDRLENSKDERMASLSDEGRRVVVYGLASFLIREKLHPIGA